MSRLFGALCALLSLVVSANATTWNHVSGAFLLAGNKNTTALLLVAAAVVVILYLMRRRKRVQS